MLRVTDKDGIDAAVTKYRELRERYYGTGSYDFGSESLGRVAETLAQEKGDLAGALRIVDLNVEAHPEDADAHVMRGQIQFASGDKEGAVASAMRALELDPENRDAKRMVDQMSGGK
jgi:Flp pilus assembly protein TadD